MDNMNVKKMRMKKTGRNVGSNVHEMSQFPSSAITPSPITDDIHEQLKYT